MASSSPTRPTSSEPRPGDVERGNGGERPKLEKIPLGYSYVAAYADGHEDIALFRRFGALKARVLLTQQAELEDMERTLKRIDTVESIRFEGSEQGPDNKTWTDDRNKERKALVNDIAISLRRYESDLLLYRKIRMLPKAQSWQIENFQNMLYSKKPLHQLESRFLNDPDDLVSLRKEKDDSEIWEPIYELGRKVFRGFGKRIFKEKSPAIFADSKDITTYSAKRMTMASRLIFAVFVTMIVTSGVIALYFVEADNWRLGVLCLATLICAVLTSVLTTAKKSEVFAVASAYCAVLVVFVGTTLQDKGGKVIDLKYGNTWINGTVSS